jgi:hypothetical protein
MIAFVAWQMPEGATFLEIEPTEPLTAQFSTLWYTNDMTKQWQSNAVFHKYYQQLKVSIEEFPRMTSRTLHQHQPIAKFHADPHFIYITARRDEHQERLQSYYKLTNVDMEQIIKDWPEAFLVPISDVDLSDTDTIGSPMVTRAEHVGQSGGTKKQKEHKKQIEVQDIESDEEEEEETSGDSGSSSPGGGEDKVEGQEEEMKEKKRKEEAKLLAPHHLKIPLL